MALILLLALAFSGCESDFMTRNIFLGNEEDLATDGGAGDGTGSETPPDDDFDGLSNEVETTFDLPARRADADDDGYSDGLEFVVNSGDPLNNSRIPLPLNRSRIIRADEITANDQDRDLDGLGNNFETRNSLNPDNPDTDGDGYQDGLELVAGSDPFVASDRPQRTTAPVSDGEPRAENPPIDSDQDGLADQIESLNGSLTNNRDTDGDGFSDGLEFVMGSELTDPLSVPNFVVPTPPESVDDDNVR